MPTIRTVGPDARARLAAKGHAQLRPYLEAIAGLTGDQALEVEPEPGETLRMVTLRAHRAARQLGTSVTCGTTQQGTVLLWLGEPTRRRRRRRQPQSDLAPPEAAAWQPPLEEMPP